MSKASFWKRFGQKLLDRGDKKQCHWCGEWVEDQSILYAKEEESGDYNYRERLKHTASVDHLEPRINGGTNALDNLVISCLPCNIGRGADKKSFKKARI